MADPHPADTRQGRLLTALARHGRFYTAQALLMIAAGALALAYPLISGPMDGTLLAWLLFFYAATLLFGLVTGRRMRCVLMQILALLLALLAGAVILIQLVEAAGLAVILIALFLLAEGAARLRQGLMLRPEAPWAFLAAGGAVPLVAGLLLLLQATSTGANTLALLVGASLIASGLGLLLTVRSLGRAQAGG